MKVLILGLVELIGSKEVNENTVVVELSLNPWFSGIDWFFIPDVIFGGSGSLNPWFSGIDWF